MNKIQAVILATLSIMIFSCNKTTCESTPIIGNCCVDSSLISGSASCFAVYDPVCGCDGVTYGNSCVAHFSGGVTSYVAGECPD
ncbi:MAG: hypothetical protein P8H35_07585 [Flavobacteriales bacterium]|nr:hypothetical protein [Flavobacteriales bacterium]